MYESWRNYKCLVMDLVRLMDEFRFNYLLVYRYFFNILCFIKGFIKISINGIVL